tara:strand:+ start:276 stop:1019 length:744 start_codon:yes stop_codon:yes gene_type:complete
MGKNKIQVQEEITRNKALMRFNVGLTLNEQTEIESDTVTITPQMFQRILTSDSLRPLIDEGIQGELDNVRNKELKSHYFGDVGDFVSKPTPNQVDLNPFAKGATDLPCPTCLAYDFVKYWELKAGLFTLTLKDVDSESITIKATGWVSISDVKLPFDATLEANYWLKDDILYYSLEDVNISSSVVLPVYPFVVQLRSSKIKISNDFWCSGTCWRIDPGMEAAIIEEFGTRKFDIGPLYNPSKKTSEE